jgi:hypothetical protein
MYDAGERRTTAAAPRRRRLRLWCSRIAALLSLGAAGGAVVLLVMQARRPQAAVVHLPVPTQHARPRPLGQAHRRRRPTRRRLRATGRPVAEQIVRNFAAFRRPRSVADTVSPALIATRARLPYFCTGDPAFHPDRGELQCTFSTYARSVSQAPSRNIRLLAAMLQFDQSRRVVLPYGLGALWWLPADGWLCALASARTSPKDPTVLSTLRCEPATSVLAAPPLLASYGPDGYLVGAEPDQVVTVKVKHPSPLTQVFPMRDHVLVAASVGLGAVLVSSTADGVQYWQSLS